MKTISINSIFAIVFLAIFGMLCGLFAQSGSDIRLLLKPPPPPEISGGAAMSSKKITHPMVEIGEPIRQDPGVSFSLGLFSTFSAINFDLDAANNSGNYHIPPDPIGAAGPSHVVNVVNTSIEWYTKAGVNEKSEGLSSFFSSLSPITNTFDPKVIYDQFAGRFLVVTLEKTDTTQGDSANTSRVLLAVSDDNNPNGTWYFHAINSMVSVGGVPTWFDYPGFAIDEEAVYLTGNMFAFDSLTYQSTLLWTVDKGLGSGGFYDGGSASVSNLDPYGATSGLGSIATTTQPAHIFGTAPPNVGTFLVSYSGLSSQGTEFLQIIRVDNPLTNPSFTHQFLPVGDIENSGVNPLPDAPQMTSPEEIEVNDRRALHAVWRDNMLYTTAEIFPGTGPDQNQVTAHWWRLNTTNPNLLVLADQGNVGGEDIATGTFTFFPSIAVNLNGDMAIGFSASAVSIFPGAYYAGRLANDPAGTIGQSATLQAGVDYYYRAFGGSRNRWGDYSGICVDPADDLTFWVFNEYALARGTVLPNWPNEDGRWGTAWGDFTLPVVSIDVPNANVPGRFELSQNYPNPFNPVTNIKYQISELEYVELKIYDISGKLVRTLVSETKAPGSYVIQWNGKNEVGIEMSSGTYFYKLETGKLVDVRKMLLLR